MNGDKKDKDMISISDLDDLDLRAKLEVEVAPIRDTFEMCLQSLMLFPAKKVAKICQICWPVIGAKIVPTALPTDEVFLRFMSQYSCINFAIVNTRAGDNVKPNPVVFLAPGLKDQAKRDPASVLGSVVYAASHVVDVYSGQICETNLPELQRQVARSKERAHIYEAEYLIELQKIEPGLMLTRWQRDTISRWPKGWESEGAKDLWYEPREWSDA